jgi:hypothetical protein
MLELQLPPPMPHALHRDSPFDFYSSTSLSSSSKSDANMNMNMNMQLPFPTIAHHHELNGMRSSSRGPLTPPEVAGSAVRVVSLPPQQGAGHQFGYQLPAIGNSRSVTAPTSPTPQRQQSQPAQDVNQTPRKKYAISPNLQIPASINTPQEGLPQLAAEVRTPQDNEIEEHAG